MNNSLSTAFLDTEFYTPRRLSDVSSSSGNFGMKVVKCPSRNTLDRNCRSSAQKKDINCALEEISDLQSRLVITEKEYSEAKEENDKLYREIAVHKKRIESLQNSIIESNTAHMHETSIISNAADNDMEEFKKTINQLENENSRQTLKIKEFENTLSDYNDLKENYAKQNEIISQQQSYIKNYEMKIDRLESEIQMIKDNLDNETAKTSKIQNNSLEIPKLKKIIETKDKELNDSKLEYKKYRKETKELSNELGKKEKEIEALNSQNIDAIDAIRKMSTELIDLKNKEEELNQTINYIKKLSKGHIKTAPPTSGNNGRFFRWSRTSTDNDT